MKIEKNYWRHGMGILALSADERVRNVHVSEDTLTVDLMDGRTISVPLVWYPRLFRATSKQLSNWKVCAAGYGIHWRDLDEDLSTEGLFARCTCASDTSTNKPLHVGEIHVTHEDECLGEEIATKEK